MRTRIFTGRLRRVALLGTLGVTLAFLAVPLIGASSASAYPGFTVSVTCTATNGQSGSKAIWDWMQGGVGGTIVASGTVWVPSHSRKWYQQRHGQRNPAGQRGHPVVHG